MPLNPLQMQEVHDEVRAYFRGGLKSFNKYYLPAVIPNAIERNKSAKLAMGLVLKLRVKHTGAQPSLPAEKMPNSFCAYGMRVLTQGDQRVGNCQEMSSAAAFLVELRGYGHAFIAELEAVDHGICIVSDSKRAPDCKTVRRFEFASGSDKWVIDPWANVCCRLQDYAKAFGAKMREWSAQGKRIVVANKNGEYMFVNPGTAVYMRDFVNAPVAYEWAGPLPACDRAFRALPPQRSGALAAEGVGLRKSACQGCVIL